MAEVGDTVHYILSCGDDNELFQSLQRNQDGSLVGNPIAALTVEGTLTALDSETMVGEVTATVNGVQRVFVGRSCDMSMGYPGTWCPAMTS